MTRASEIILWPVIAGQHLSWLHYRRQSKAWNVLTENVWVGRRLTNSEAASAIDAGVTAVIDLTSEFNAPRLFRSLEYLHLPILDLTAPTPEQLDRAVEFIQSHSINGVVYIHCKAGYSRTAAVAGAFLLATAQAGDTQEAISLLRTARPTIIIRPEACKSIVQYHARRRNGSPRTPLQTTPNPLPCLAVY